MTAPWTEIAQIQKHRVYQEGTGWVWEIQHRDFLPLRGRVATEDDAKAHVHTWLGIQNQRAHELERQAAQDEDEEYGE